MENIKVYDDFFGDKDMNKIVKIISTNKWDWNHTSTDEALTPTPFWSMDLIDNEFFTDHLKSIIENHFSRKFKINRVYANGQTFGQDGNYHIDDDKPNTYTACLYISHLDKKLIDTAGGYICFKLPNQKFSLCFEPLFNRLVFFPSHYLHKSTSFTRYIMDLRICVAWKLEEVVETII